MEREPDAEWGTESLLAESAKGNDRALDVLFARYRRIAQRMLRHRFGPSLCGQDRDDVVQDALLKAFRDLDQFTGESNFRGWMFRILERTALSSIRREEAQKRDRRLTVSMDDPQHGVQDPRKVTTPSEHASAEELHERALVAIDALPERSRIVYSLRHECGKSIREIADELDLTEANVKVILHRALAAIGLHLAREAGQGGAS